MLPTFPSTSLSSSSSSALQSSHHHLCYLHNHHPHHHCHWQYLSIHTIHTYCISKKSNPIRKYKTNIRCSIYVFEFCRIKNITTITFFTMQRQNDRRRIKLHKSPHSCKQIGIWDWFWHRQNHLVNSHKVVGLRRHPPCSEKKHFKCP